MRCSIGRLNAAGRSRTDAVVVMDLDSPVGDGYEFRELTIQDGPRSKFNEQPLSLVGLTWRDNPDGTIELLLVNNKPSINTATGELLDNAQAGANTTIEQFVTAPDVDVLIHQATHAHDRIATPNNVAWDGAESFYLTNDHGRNKVGWVRLTVSATRRIETDEKVETHPLSSSRDWRCDTLHN